jgi:hypothetical protein
MCNNGKCIKLTSSNNNKVSKSSEVAAGYNKHENATPSKIKHGELQQMSTKLQQQWM